MLPVHRPQRNWGARVHDGHVRGIYTIVLENEKLRISILAGKGTDIVEILYKPLDLDFNWLTPGGIRNPTSYLSSSPDPQSVFTDSYPGGWQEVFPNGGAPSEANGTSYGQHGEVFALPWDVELVKDEESEVVVRFSVRAQKTPARIVKTIRLAQGEAMFAISERVINESDDTFQAMWGHHITFGLPFLKPGSRITVPEGTGLHTHNRNPGNRRIDPEAAPTWPITKGADGAPLDLSLVPERGTASEMLYFTGFPDATAWYQVEDESRGVGAKVSWEREQMPFLWFWQEFGALKRYPWYGRVNVVGLEPFSSMPSRGLGGAVENGTAFTLGPEEEREFWLNYEIVDRHAR